MKKLIALMMLLPGMALGAATTLEVEFTVPTTRTDGTPLPVAEIAELVFYDGCDSTPLELMRLSSTSNSTVDVEWEKNSAHSMCFSTIDTDGQVGALSNSYNFIFEFLGAPPSAGTVDNVTVTCVTGDCRAVVN